ncbi:MAG: hypothetical protein K2H41_12590 [Acetatifactor sp.]|nr:hypothetical protein [Acetatifactor sp.]
MKYQIDENGMPVLTNIRYGLQDENGNIEYYESTTNKDSTNLVTDIFVGSMFGILIGICIAIVILYLKWLFIRSAVESGVQRAIEKTLKNYEVVDDPNIENHP